MLHVWRIVAGGWVKLTFVCCSYKINSFSKLRSLDVCKGAPMPLCVDPLVSLVQSPAQVIDRVVPGDVTVTRNPCYTWLK